MEEVRHPLVCGFRTLVPFKERSPRAKELPVCPGPDQTCQVSRYETGTLALLRQPAVSCVYRTRGALSITQATVQVPVT